MNFELFIAKRLTIKAQRTFSKLIVRVAIGGITLGLAVMIISLAIVSGFKSGISDKVTGFAGHIQITRFDLNNSPENSALKLSPALLSSLKSIAEVKNVQSTANKVGIIKAGTQIEPIVLKGVGKDFDWSFFASKLIEGQRFQPNDSGINYAMVSQFTAQRLNLKTGDNFLVYFADKDIRIRKFKISGVFDLGMEELDKVYMLCDISLVQKLNSWQKNEVGGLELNLKNDKYLDEVVREVNDKIGEELAAYTVKETYPAVFDWLSLLDINGEVIAVLMLLVAGINMISALLIMILERAHMIGILKSLGVGNWSVRKIFLYNALYLIGFGMLAGNALGIGFCLLQEHFHLISLDPKSYYVSYVPVELSWKMILILNTGTLISCAAMLLIPSMLISKISPVKVLRFN